MVALWWEPLGGKVAPAVREQWESALSPHFCPPSSPAAVPASAANVAVAGVVLVLPTIMLAESPQHPLTLLSHNHR